MDFKTEIFEKLCKETDKESFENWIYTSNEKDFQNVLGNLSTIDILGESYGNMNLSQIKEFLYDCFDEKLKNEFMHFIFSNQSVIKAKCIRNTGPDYGGKKTRNWDLEIGKDYYVFRISVSNKDNFFKITYQIFDPVYNDTTPYLIPSYLFEINNFSIPIGYKISIRDGEIDINLAEFDDNSYVPVEYSFWEDYFEGHKKAVDIFNTTLFRLGIKLDFKTN